MINIVHDGGQAHKINEPLATLASRATVWDLTDYLSTFLIVLLLSLIMSKIETELFSFQLSFFKKGKLIFMYACRKQGKISFRILLRYEFCEQAGEENDMWLQVGEGIHPNSL